MVLEFKDWRKMSICYIEDDESDVEMFKHILTELKFDGQISHFESGEQFLETSINSGKKQEIKPNIIFLDISLPGTNGKEILRLLKNTDHLRDTPIIMLSGSNSEKDFKECVTNGCNGYIIKSSDKLNFKEACMRFLMAWFSISSQKFV